MYKYVIEFLLHTRLMLFKLHLEMGFEGIMATKPSVQAQAAQPSLAALAQPPQRPQPSLVAQPPQPTAAPGHPHPAASGPSPRLTATASRRSAHQPTVAATKNHA